MIPDEPFAGQVHRLLEPRVIPARSQVHQGHLVLLLLVCCATGVHLVRVQEVHCYVFRRYQHTVQAQVTSHMQFWHGSQVLAGAGAGSRQELSTRRSALKMATGGQWKCTVFCVCVLCRVCVSRFCVCSVLCAFANHVEMCGRWMLRRKLECGRWNVREVGGYFSLMWMLRRELEFEAKAQLGPEAKT